MGRVVTAPSGTTATNSAAGRDCYGQPQAARLLAGLRIMVGLRSARCASVCLSSSSPACAAAFRLCIDRAFRDFIPPLLLRCGPDLSCPAIDAVELIILIVVPTEPGVVGCLLAEVSADRTGWDAELLLGRNFRLPSRILSQIPRYATSVLRHEVLCRRALKFSALA